MTKDPFDNNKIKVPFFKPQITNEDKNVVANSLNSLILTNGPNLKQFEKSFSNYTKSKYAIGLSSATAALHLSLLSLGIGKGDQVLVPDITFAATANAVLMTGATPVLVDVNLDDYNINMRSIEKNLTKKTRAIIPVHVAGKICQIDKINYIAKKRDIFIIEDCAHAIGCRLNKKHAGTFGDLGCFSFYPTKNITTLEGGMVITNSKRLAAKIENLRNHGISRSLKERYSKGFPWEYDVVQPGYNYRLDEIRSILGINQLKRIEKINSARRNAFKYYYENLSDVEGLCLPSIEDLNNNACHLFISRVIKNNFGFTRNYVFKYLLKNGISTSVHYKPLHLFSAFKNAAIHKDNLKNSQRLYDEILSLPLYTGIKVKEQNLVINTIKRLKNQLK